MGSKGFGVKVQLARPHGPAGRGLWLRLPRARVDRLHGSPNIQALDCESNSSLPHVFGAKVTVESMSPDTEFRGKQAQGLCPGLSGSHPQTALAIAGVHRPCPLGWQGPTFSVTPRNWALPLSTTQGLRLVKFPTPPHGAESRAGRMLAEASGPGRRGGSVHP